MEGRNRGMDDFFQGGHSPLFQFSLFPVCNYFSHQCFSFSEKTAPEIWVKTGSPSSLHLGELACTPCQGNGYLGTCSGV